MQPTDKQVRRAQRSALKKKRRKERQRLIKDAGAMGLLKGFREKYADGVLKRRRSR